MKRIDELTPEQSARFEEWSKQWIEIGLSTEPADFDKATEAALRAYQLANFGASLLARKSKASRSRLKPASSLSVIQKRGTITCLNGRAAQP